MRLDFLPVIKFFMTFNYMLTTTRFLATATKQEKKKRKKIVILIIKAIFVINSCKSRLQKKIFKQRYYRYLKFSSSISKMRPLQLLIRKTKHNIFLIKFMGVIF